MKVLLVRPPVPRETIGLKHLMTCEPLELEYAGASLTGEHDVQILDLQLERGLERRLREFRPDVVGTSCYITGVGEALRVCRTVKRWNPAVHTVVGGVHASLVPEDFADPAVDIIVQGDGTSALPRLLRALEPGRSPLELPQLDVADGSGGLRFSPRGAYMPDPDSLPFPQRDLTAHLRHRYFYVYHAPLALLKTTWGCWYDCNFCFNWRVTGGPAFARSPESVAAELQGIAEPEVYIVDDIFLINRRRLARLAELLRERGIRKHYLCFSRADFIAQNEAVIAEWAELGLSAVLIGLEAATDAELQSMEKRSTVRLNREAVAVLRRNGVDPYGSLIPQPDYLPEDWERLARFIDETGLYYLNISPLTPLPGTTIWPEYQDRITVRRDAHALWDLSHVVLPTRMPLKAYYRALLRVYGRTVFDISRARRVTLRPRPPLLSRASLRIWWGVLRAALQFWNAHRHHHARTVCTRRSP
ncbi:MAG: radical SAM protein [Gemmatimonadetes bacterium]|nr:radical SAM protein [Gemmatimonadota bacterium]